MVLDVRNSYEWDAGHFSGAARPAEVEFNETPTEATPAEVPAHLQAVDPDTPVMMYCTGGIRCDVYSTYLRQKGCGRRREGPLQALGCPGIPAGAGVPSVSHPASCR